MAQVQHGPNEVDDLGQVLQKMMANEGGDQRPRM